MSNKDPVITLYYDSQAQHAIYSHILKGETTIGSEHPSPVLNDKTVEKAHLSITLKGSTIHILNKSTKHGTCAIIPPHTPTQLKYHQYIVIGVTWISFTKENGKAVIALIRPDFTVINCCRVDYGRTLIIGRSTTKCDIALKDTCVSKTHIRVTINEEEIECEDLGSANHVFISLDELSIEKSESSPLLRLGEKTFLKYEYKEAPAMKAKMECFFPENPAKYMGFRLIKAIL